MTRNWKPLRATNFLIKKAKNKASQKEKEVNQLLFDYPNMTRKEAEELIN